MCVTMWGSETGARKPVEGEPAEDHATYFFVALTRTTDIWSAPAPVDEETADRVAELIPIRASTRSLAGEPGTIGFFTQPSPVRSADIGGGRSIDLDISGPKSRRGRARRGSAARHGHDHGRPCRRRKPATRSVRYPGIELGSPGGARAAGPRADWPMPACRRPRTRPKHRCVQRRSAGRRNHR